VIVAAIYLAILRVIDAKTGACSVCGEDEDWSNYPYLFAIAAVLPVVFVVMVGVGTRKARDGARRAARHRRMIRTNRTT
jgi:phosphotransferase system  glucose/maltose/N-acetylglucosamine-specific IIC component